MFSPIKHSMEHEREGVAKRAKRKQSWIVCAIELDGGVIARETTASLVSEVCKYLMYDRNQIPVPISRAQPLVESQLYSQPNARLSQTQRVVMQMLDSVNQLFDELLCVTRCQLIPTINCVCLSLGHTLQTPKELYCIEMPTTDAYNIPHTKDCHTVGLKSSMTRFFKTILNDSNVLFYNRKEISATKAYLLMRIARNDAHHLIQHSQKYHSNDSQQLLFTPQNNYCLPKIGNRYKFTIKLKACQCQTVSNQNFEIYEDRDESQHLQSEMLNEKMLNLSINNSLNKVNEINECQPNDELVWIQILSPIKGIQYNCDSNRDVFLPL